MDLQKLFEQIESEVLTEEVKLQISTLFESAVNEAIAQKEVALEEQNRAEISEFKESMTEQIDEYLNYFVEEFVKENEDLIDNKVKVKTATKILETFSKIVNDFNMELSEEKESCDEELESLKVECNKLTNKLIESKKEIQTVTKAAMIAEAGSYCGLGLKRGIALGFDEALFPNPENLLGVGMFYLCAHNT
jgi:hypothetical protein